MKLMQTLKVLVGSRRLSAGLLSAIFVAGALFTWWLAVRAELEMREDLLNQTRLTAGAVAIKRLSALTGTEADLESPHYIRFKEQFASIRASNPQCRFVYLMGRKPDGTVFIFVDSEPAGSKDYSPPGQVYEEVPDAFRDAFDTRAAVVVGPVSDRWGTWVSALVPLTDQQKSGDVLALLGMDIDARIWRWNVASRSALPVGLAML